MTESNKPLTQADVRRIQSATAKANGGKVPKDSFAAKVQSIVDKRSK
ncbi:hypothetical protein ABS858_13285 [Vibrio neptunius]